MTDGRQRRRGASPLPLVASFVALALALALTCGGGGFPSPVHAAVLQWCGPNFGAWHTTSYWSDDGGLTCMANVIPTVTDDVVLASTAPMEVRLISGNAEANTLNVSGPGMHILGFTTRQIQVVTTMRVMDNAAIDIGGVIALTTGLATQRLISETKFASDLIHIRSNGITVTGAGSIVLVGPGTHQIVSYRGPGQSVTSQTITCDSIVLGTPPTPFAILSGLVGPSTLRLIGLNGTRLDVMVQVSFQALNVYSSNAQIIARNGGSITIYGGYTVNPPSSNLIQIMPGECMGVAGAFTECVGATATVRNIHLPLNGVLYVQVPGNGGILNITGRISSDQAAASNGFAILGDHTLTAPYIPSLFVTAGVDPNVTFTIGNGGGVHWHMMRRDTWIRRFNLALNPDEFLEFSGADLKVRERISMNSGGGIRAYEAGLNMLLPDCQISSSARWHVSGTGSINCTAGISFLPAGEYLELHIDQTSLRGIDLGAVEAGVGGGTIIVCNHNTTRYNAIPPNQNVSFRANPLNIPTLRFSGPVEWKWYFPSSSVLMERTIVFEQFSSTVAVPIPNTAPMLSPMIYNISGRLTFSDPAFVMYGVFQTQVSVRPPGTAPVDYDVPFNARFSDFTYSHPWLVFQSLSTFDCRSGSAIRGALNVWFREGYIVGPCNDTVITTSEGILGASLSISMNGGVYFPRFAVIPSYTIAQTSVIWVGAGTYTTQPSVFEVADDFLVNLSLLGGSGNTRVQFNVDGDSTIVKIKRLQWIAGPFLTFKLLHPKQLLQLTADPGTADLTDVTFEMNNLTTVEFLGQAVLSYGVTFQSRAVEDRFAPTLILSQDGSIRYTNIVPANVHFVVNGDATVKAFPALLSLTIRNGYLIVEDTGTSIGAAPVRTTIRTLEMYAPSGILATTADPNTADYQINVTSRFDTILTNPILANESIVLRFDHVHINTSANAIWTIDSPPQFSRIKFYSNAAYTVNGGVISRCPTCVPYDDARLSVVLFESDSNMASTMALPGTGSSSYVQLYGFDWRNTSSTNVTFLFYQCMKTADGVQLPVPSRVLQPLPPADAECVAPISYCTELHPCSLNGTTPGACVDIQFPNSYYCPCKPGFSGRNCTTFTPPDYCASSPCQNGGTCTGYTSPPYSYYCTCPPTAYGHHCHHLLPPDPCQPMPPECGPHVATCIPFNNNQEFRCVCQAKWSGLHCDQNDDPCLQAVSPCRSHEFCQVLQYENGTVYGYNCICETGNKCGEEIPEPTLVSLYPTTATPNGGQYMTLVTRGFPATSVRIQFGSVAVNTSNGDTDPRVRPLSEVKTLPAGTVLTPPITFNWTYDMTVPSDWLQLKFQFYSLPYPLITRSSYRLIVVTFTKSGVGGEFEISSNSLLYYSFNPCLDEGQLLQYDPDSGIPYCASCPTGGFCPGGGRVWPTVGYWSRGEFATPVQCTLIDACPGSMGEVDGYPVQTLEDGSRDTARCTRAYEGEFCSKCASNYYLSGQRCFSCGSTTDDDVAALRFLIAAAVILFIALTVAVASLSSHHLAWVVTVLIAVQQFVIIGKSSIQALPDNFDWLVQFIGFLSIINFDVEMVKPGCLVPALPFLSLYWATLTLIAVFLGMFLIGAAVRASWVWQFRLKPLIAERNQKERERKLVEDAVKAALAQARAGVNMNEVMAAQQGRTPSNRYANGYHPNGTPTANGNGNGNGNEMKTPVRGGGSAQPLMVDTLFTNTPPMQTTTIAVSPSNKTRTPKAAASASAAAAAASAAASSTTPKNSQVPLAVRRGHGVAPVATDPSLRPNPDGHTIATVIAHTASIGQPPRIEMIAVRTASSAAQQQPTALRDGSSSGGGTAAAGATPPFAKSKSSRGGSGTYPSVGSGPSGPMGGDGTSVSGPTAPSAHPPAPASNHSGSTRTVASLDVGVNPHPSHISNSSRPETRSTISSHDNSNARLLGTTTSTLSVPPTVAELHEPSPDLSNPNDVPILPPVTASEGMDERDWAESWCDVFTARAIQSTLILASLVFLKLLTLSLHAIHCQRYSGTDSNEFQTSGSVTRLVADLSTICYSGQHRDAAILDYFIILCFGVGVPLTACLLLWRAFRPSVNAAQVMPHGADTNRQTHSANTNGSGALMDGVLSSSGSVSDAALRQNAAEAEMRLRARRNDRFGYLYRGLIPAAYFFRLFTFITSWGFAIQNVFSHSAAIQLFVPGLFFLLHVIGTALLWPYASSLNNVISIWVGFGGVLQVEVYLGLIGSSASAPPNGVWAFLYFMLVLTALSGSFILYWRYRHRVSPHSADGKPLATVITADGERAIQATAVSTIVGAILAIALAVGESARR